MTSTKINNLIVAVNISPEALAKLERLIHTVHYFPDGIVPRKYWKDAEFWYVYFTGLPEGIKTVEDVPKTRGIQLSSAGANNALQHPIFKTEKGRKQIAVCSASGIHSLSIPQWIISHTINLYMSNHIYMYEGRNQGKWVRNQVGEMIKNGTIHEGKSMYGKTAGLLGYGHIARETARVLKAMNVRIIAANSTGTKRADEGYIIAGTGDPDGSIPEAYYSTSDPKSFKDFLSRSDILIASLPSTPTTTNLLKAEHFKHLPQDAIFLNVGRGDLVSSDVLLDALNSTAPNRLYGVALDVTDPEPLTDDHPLFTHPRAIITPHVSAMFKGYFDAGADLLKASLEHYRKEGSFYNVVDPEKGY